MLSNLHIRHKLLIANIGTLVPVLVFCSIATYAILKNTIEANIQSELENTTTAILNMVRTSVSVSIQNHLKASAQSNRDIAAFYHDMSRRGLITEAEAKTRAARAMGRQRIGQTGYIYCVNSLGVITVHPDPQVMNTDLSGFPFIREQIRRRSGYLEYQWKNPGKPHTQPSPKALYMVYFEPWDWIISASSYRAEFADLININDFTQSILSLRFGKTGYSYVIDTTGTLIVHPKLQGANIIDSKDAEGRMFIKEMVAKKSGKIVYPWKNPGETAPREKLVIFNHIDELGWILASSSYLDEFYLPLKRLQKAVIATLIITLFLVIGISYAFGASITGPLKRLMERFSVGASGDFSARVEHPSKDEIGLLADYFNSFMERLEIYQKSLKDEIRDRKEAQAALTKTHGELEERVRDRTRDLEQTNSRLEGEMAERRLAEAALRRQMQLVETVINTMTHPVFYLDSQGRYLGCNTAFAQQVFGTTPDQVIGRSLDDLKMRLPSPAIEIHRRKNKELIRRPGKVVYEKRVLCADDIHRDFLFSKATFTDEDGRAEGIVGMMMDLTHQKKAEKDRLVHEKLSGVLEMAGAVCHELNQPLQAVSGHAHMLSLALASTDSAQGKIEKLLFQVERMGEITRKLMGISRYVTKHYVRGVKIIDIDLASDPRQAPVPASPQSRPVRAAGPEPVSEPLS